MGGPYSRPEADARGQFAVRGWTSLIDPVEFEVNGL
jgi:hypothetical protein